VGDSNLVVVSHGFLNVLDRYLPVLNREQIAQSILGYRQRNLLAVKARICSDPLQRSLELADVRANVLGDEEGDLLVELHPRLCGLGKQNGYPHLELRRL